MTLAHLLEVLPPPTTPIESGRNRDWTETEGRIGIALPDDYKQYINTYGSGQIGGFLLPFNPFSGNEYVNLVDQIRVRLDALRVIRDKYGPKECPYPLFPEKGGLLPWGATDNGDVLFWLTKGEPRHWAVIINESRSPLFERHAESMTDLLAKLITGEVRSEIFPEDFPDKEALFRQLR